HDEPAARLVACRPVTLLVTNDRRQSASSREQMQPSCGQTRCLASKCNHLAGKRDVSRANATITRANAMSREQMQPSRGQTRCLASKCNHLAGKRDVSRARTRVKNYGSETEVNPSSRRPDC